jgi:hypothetical protein
MTIRSMLAMVVLVLAACATESGPEPEAGFHGNTFTEPTRGIHATLPTGWVFVTPDKFAEIQDAGAKKVGERNPDLALPVAEAVTRTKIMFVMANASGSPTLQETIALAAERLSSLYLGVTDETYALALRSNLQSTGYSVNSQEMESVEISGSRFQSVQVILPPGSGSGYQSYYVRIVNNEALTFIITHNRQNRGAALLEIIQSVDLR